MCLRAFKSPIQHTIIGSYTAVMLKMKLLLAQPLHTAPILLLTSVVWHCQLLCFTEAGTLVKSCATGAARFICRIHKVVDKEVSLAHVLPRS